MMTTGTVHSGFRKPRLGKPMRGEDVLAEMKFKWITTREQIYAHKLISGKVYRKKIPTNANESFSRASAFKDETPINYFLENAFYEYKEEL